MSADETDYDTTGLGAGYIRVNVYSSVRGGLFGKPLLFHDEQSSPVLLFFFIFTQQTRL